MIRSYKIEDLNNVMNLWLDTNIEAHSFIDKTYWQDNYAMVKDVMPRATIYVYIQDNEIQAFIGLIGNYIEGIFVSNEFQSKGIGKALLDYTKVKNNELSLSVYKKNNRAVRFYLREGFSVTAEQIDENTGEIDFLMKWAK
ncbi:N-acetyltransferase [Clostridium sporogenes]|uniref:N-acetyltransferase n=1 Tax=Clostridium TaxID=1485 RepID=UPI003DA6B62D